ncbi:hypothetical protein SEVIR_2G414500v4 [Setaria viridis]|nr:uncharacterized protein LOC117845871 [Setaria viridis]TKW36045.1 hypothetical protein SEVIR_2G414500v2 [Setaria viridis]
MRFGHKKMGIARWKRTRRGTNLSGGRGGLYRSMVEAALAEWKTEGEADEEMDFGSDDEALRAKYSQFRRFWMALWSNVFGSFDGITHIPAMRYTDDPSPPRHACCCHTLQFFSAKIAEIRGGLQFPLDVFGIIAVRDSIEPRRNIVFSRPRNNCQTLTQQDPYLELIGPTRAIVVNDPATIEVMLKVKGSAESDDRILCIQAEQLRVSPTIQCQRLLERAFISKRSTVFFTLGQIRSSVEATIFVRVMGGSWRCGFHGQFGARVTRDPRGRAPDTSIDYEKVTLLVCEDLVEQSRVTDSGDILLSRRVLSAVAGGKLIVFVRAWQDDGNIVRNEAVFTPKKAGRSTSDKLEFGFCTMEVTVAWSLISFRE